MYGTLNPYPAYTPSSVPWLGDVPAHWEVLPNRAIFMEVNDQEHPEEQMLSVTIAEGVIRQQTLLEGSSKKDASRLDRSAYKLVQPGDIAYNKMRAWQGAIGVSGYRGIVSPAYVVQRPRKGMDSRYLHYLLRTPAFAEEAERWSYGITSDMWSLRPEHFKMIYSCVPPLPEQTAIVRYLDHADRQMRRYIDGKETLIGLLEEQRQAVVQHAVTRGLDPDVRLKPSGIDWLGDVPAHWEVRRLKWVASLNPSKREVRASLLADTPVTFLPMERVGTDGRIESGEMLPASDVWNGFTYFERKDVLVAKITPCFENGKGACLDSLPTKVGFGSTEFHVLRAGPSTSPQFLYRLTTLEEFRRLGVNAMIGAAGQQRVPQAFVANYPIAIPPLPEQAAIVEHLDKATADIDTAIANTRREIDLLREYRTRLIADVVTGKADVREAAAGLGEEVDETKPGDQIVRGSKK